MTHNSEDNTLPQLRPPSEPGLHPRHHRPLGGQTVDIMQIMLHIIC